MKKIRTGRGYAWECDFGLCHWVRPSKHSLLALAEGGKPSPEAKAVPVRIVKESDWRGMVTRYGAS